jgi:GTPase SAR1 family protein
MFAYNWIKNKFISTLEYTGLKKKKMLRFVVLGIDDAGKTTLILRLEPTER